MEIQPTQREGAERGDTRTLSFMSGMINLGSGSPPSRLIGGVEVKVYYLPKRITWPRHCEPSGCSIDLGVLRNAHLRSIYSKRKTGLSFD